MSAWPPSSGNQSVYPAKCRANCFGDKNAEKCLTRGLRGDGGGWYAFPFIARILYLRLKCKTLYINRNGFRPAWGGFEVERLFHAQNEVSPRFGFGHGKGLPICWGNQVILPSIVWKQWPYRSQKADFTNSPSETVNRSHRFCYWLNGCQLTHLLT